MSKTEELILKLLFSATVCYEKNLQLIKERAIENEQIRGLYKNIVTVEGTYKSMLISRIAESNIDINSVKSVSDIEKILIHDLD